MKKIIIISGVVIALAGVGFATLRTKAQEPVKKEAAKPALTVNVAMPTFEKLPLKIISSGTIVPWQESVIGSELSGVAINAIYVDVGDLVKKGQVLAKLNSESITADVNQVQAALQEANANFEEAKANAEIARTIEKTNALSAQKVKQYLTAELTAKARVESAQASLKSQTVRLKQTTIVAPDDGIVSSRNAAVGNIVTQGEMFKIIRQEKLQWKAQVPSDQIMKITKDMPVEIKTKNNDIIKAQVSEIAPSVDAQTRQGTIYVNMDKSLHMNKVKSGMFVEGNISLGVQDKMMIPQQAVILRDGFNSVFVVNNNIVKQVKVTTGERLGNNVEVSGIDSKDNVVITGATFLKDEDTVKVVK
jgi:RND family efflux transporter MFP subunit